MSEPSHPNARIVEVEEDGRLRALLSGVLLLIVVSGTVDLILDAPDRWWSFHVVYEVAIIIGGLATTAWLWARWARAERALSRTRRDLHERQAERDAWRTSAEKALLGFAAAIDDQLARWGLTAAEREVALQMLKGKSHKVIAYETGRSERTVRQHAVTVYQKSELAGRAELAAFFLEGLALPNYRAPSNPCASASARASSPGRPTNDTFIAGIPSAARPAGTDTSGRPSQLP
jgi:DNA-binding CsgD family transcriptional regulator